MSLEDGVRKAAEIQSHRASDEVTYDAQAARCEKGLDPIGEPEIRLHRDVPY